jgi:hypothetical protein
LAIISSASISLAEIALKRKSTLQHIIRCQNRINFDVFTYAYKYKHICIYIYIYIYVYISLHMFEYVYLFMYIYIYIFVFTNMYINKDVHSGIYIDMNKAMCHSIHYLFGA